MNRLFFSITFFILLSVSAATLKENMRDFNAHFKVISATIADSTKNADNAARAREMSQIFVNAKNNVPTSIDSLPPEHKQKAIEQYQGMIQQVIDATTQLQQALLDNDITKAKAILETMKKLKLDGHEKFKN